jgi:hypothetical protein
MIELKRLMTIAVLAIGGVCLSVFALSAMARDAGPGASSSGAPFYQVEYYSGSRAPAPHASPIVNDVDDDDCDCDDDDDDCDDDDC